MTVHNFKMYHSRSRFPGRATFTQQPLSSQLQSSNSSKVIMSSVNAPFLPWFCFSEILLQPLPTERSLPPRFFENWRRKRDWRRWYATISQAQRRQTSLERTIRSWYNDGQRFLPFRCVLFSLTLSYQFRFN